ncbi:substrate-binding domain-containing protein [Paenibacillus sp. TAF58]
MTKNKKLFASVMVMSLTAFAMSGCQMVSSSSDANKKTSQAAISEQKPVLKKDRKSIKIGYSQFTLGAPYFVAIVEAAKKTAEEMGVQFVSIDGQDNINKQLSDVDDLLAKNIDVLIMDPKDPIAQVPATKAATKAGVPVIIVDSSIDPSADFVTTIQSNNLANGELVGEWLAKQMKNKQIKMALLSGAQGNPVGKERRQGVIRGLTETQISMSGGSSFEIVAQGWGNWGNEGGLKAMEDILTAHPDVNVLVTENDSMALGAMKAIQAAGKKNDILIVAAADGQKEALELIKSGDYGVTGMNNPALIGKTAVETAVKLLEEGGQFPKVTYTPPVAITKENAAKYYDPNAKF